ncbi:hypothetical protein BIW11_06774 [Tropilaelaps mercedesae]|uniref:SAM domain-containing protein n=1 Tax=Tropilaelaps mercedesae TaxID=418985 RepID=A0A1V9XWZ5_9ACAR|nr:hypothetical protein BIW11_06774 [Tropilaelaps mercedesae]
MNVPIVSSAGTSFVLSQTTVSPHSHMAPPEAPPTSTPTAQQMAVSTPPHVASPHMASSPVPPSAATSIQFSQGPTSVGPVMSQSPTVIQTMAQGGTLQFPSQMPVLQQGTLSPAGYIQPLYQTAAGQQQMLLSPASSLALQQQLGQGQITVMAGPGPQTPNAQKLTQDGHGKTVLTGVSGQANKSAQVMTSQAGQMANVGGKMTMATGNIMAGIAGHKGNAQTASQIVTGVAPQAQFVTQTSGNGQTLLISPLSMLGTQGSMVGNMGGMLQAQSAQSQVGKAGQGQQTQVAHKFLPAGQQKGAHSPSLQLTGLPPGTQYRHLSPAAQQQLIAGQVGVSQVNAVGQPVLGQAQTILGSLQTFNAFGSGLPWGTGQLQGQPLLQSPILIRNQHDGSVYIQSAPAAPHTQQQHQLQQPPATTVQVQPQALQNTAGTLGGQGVSTVQQMQGVAGMLHGTVMHGGPVPTLVQAQTQQQQAQAQATQQTQSAQQASNSEQTAPSGQATGAQQITAQGTMTSSTGPPPTASPSQPASAFQPVQQLSAQAGGQVVTTVQTPMQAAGAPRVQRPITPQQTSGTVGVKVSTGSRGVRGIAARSSSGANSTGVQSTATPPNSQPPTPIPPVTPTLSMDIENTKSMPVTQGPSQVIENKKQDVATMDTASMSKTPAVAIDSKGPTTAINITENQVGGPTGGATAGVVSSVDTALKPTSANAPMPPTVAAVQPLELIHQPITTVPVVTLPDVPDVPEGSSASPAIGAPFPEEAGNVPDTIEQASEILTHIIEGYVIRESSEPFPVSRSALLSEMIRREQACAGSKERKRKLENNNNVSKTMTATSTAAPTPGTVTTTNTSAANATNSARYTVASGTTATNLGLSIDQLGLDSGTKPVTAEAVEKDAKERTVSTSRSLENVTETPVAETGSSTAAFSQQVSDAVGAAACAGPAGDESKGGNRSNRSPAQWNVQDVYDFIKSVPGCAAYAEEFRVQEIDGEALMFLSAERHLMQQMNMKVGPAAKIYARLTQLCNEYGS